MKRLLYFYATWCPPCKFYYTVVIAPLMNKLGEKVIKKIDADQNPSQISRYNITRLPALVILDEEGNVILNRYGSLPMDKLVAILTS